ncbi:protein phosphatase 2C domain-containing protein [Micromonospora globbae]|uniref:Protein phosphatase 2C domain-containing protein n=1 Tax=Micromonospora globbae TaxID=1894969 RepID=A0ABZ1S9U1_9ACTN|nr:protein phosphatase 2C domain-containing protein [Micromonospora globbae]
MTARWTVLGGSAAGGAHARAGRSGQDAYAIVEDAGVLLIVLADGAGSRRCAATGSSLAVALAGQVFTALLAGRPPRTAAEWEALLDAAGHRLSRRFRRGTRALTRAVGGFHPDDLATTVTVVVARPPWLAVLAVGDGIVVVRTADGALELLAGPPDEAHRPPGATELLPRAGSHARRVVVHRPDLTGLAVSTDGLDDLLVEYDTSRGRRPGADAFGQLFALAEAPEPDATVLNRLLGGARVGALTDDDRTLVLAVPR